MANGQLDSSGAPVRLLQNAEKELSMPNASFALKSSSRFSKVEHTPELLTGCLVPALDRRGRSERLEA